MRAPEPDLLAFQHPRREEGSNKARSDSGGCRYQGFPGGSVGKESTCNVGDLGSIPGLGRSPGKENGYPLQYSGLENSGLGPNSQIRLSDFHFHQTSETSFPVKESTCNAGDPGSIPGSRRSPGNGIDYPLQYSSAFLMEKNPPAMWETCDRSLGWEDHLEEGTATHSSILA